MLGYPDVRAAGASIEIALEQGITLVADVGDAAVATELEDVWAKRHNLAAHIALLSLHLSKADSISKSDHDLRAIIAALRRQIDELELSCKCF
ncbi:MULTISPECIES: hypothetical protein [unclassified Chelatococcus]|uniref:hypothetical protein n=1 Tax=unclassified Chelatococcus TaxID=2638111 RepID=UPI001BCE6999|nr:MULTISPECIES: hypothetical protein [unclassified Chelatococcus]MBS7743725.1 hypothetical protein [Chelatococcus sp. HY11]MBX3547433.1 hypothetical protein [Chelatococcus sp.]CAH1664663.1 conserved hypothetical protein [Hyphomicrobiales bacterium]CAH1688411.1 conserved hypothetical protein [Hyphomicrobiales bacterium]